MQQIAKALDRYVEARSKAKPGENIDSKLQSIIEGILRRCIKDGEYKQVRSLPLQDVCVYIDSTTHPLKGNWHCARITSTRRSRRRLQPYKGSGAAVLRYGRRP